MFWYFGPKSRSLLTDIFGNEFQTNQFPFGQAKFIKIDNINILFQRLSFVGELGWELYIPIKESKKIYDLINKTGIKYKLVHAGRLAMDIMRMEKGYLHWGHDISPEENPFEAGLGFVVKLSKNVDFIGKKNLLKIKENLKKQLVILSLIDSSPGKPLLLHDEPIYYKGKIVGETTSGNFSFCYNKNIAFGYINSNINIENVKNDFFEIEVAKNKYKARLETEVLHDPKNILIKS
tara:strand:+ start:37 stop:741 length:705 start_codon:yes stop_codon:yes gene_type:complete